MPTMTETPRGIRGEACSDGRRKKDVVSYRPLRTDDPRRRRPQDRG